MSYSFPTFKSGNTNFANALNAVVAAAKKHGVNPGGRPGWSETENGWLPPHIFSTATSSFRWDLERSKIEPEKWTLLNPSVTYSLEDVTQEVTIEMEPFELAEDKWVVAKMVGPINDFLLNPIITIEVLAEADWESYPSAYEFGPDPFDWQVTRIPLHKVEYVEPPEPGDPPNTGDALLIAENVYATKLIGPYPTLAFTLATVPDENRTRVVPTFL
jgi:hypothetical protein